MSPTKKNTSASKTEVSTLDVVEARLTQNVDTLFLTLDQKIEGLRKKSDELLALQHERDLNYDATEKSLTEKLHAYQLQLKELESSMQYLSHKTQMQLKEMDNQIQQIQRDTQLEVKQIHFQCREDISQLSRRIEAIEKLLI